MISGLPSSRRKFLFNLSQGAGTFLAANATVYLVGSAFKRLDGSLVAGAKYCCMGAVKSSVLCGGNGVYAQIDRLPTSITSADCKQETSDYYGVVPGCVSSYVDSSCP